jgi:hypothetical protein
MMITGPDDPNRIDRVCAALAIAAGVHCMYAARLGMFLPALAGERAHLFFALAAVVPGVPAVVRGWWTHRSLRALGWALPGWLALGLARLGGDRQVGEVTEVLLTVAAAALLFIAHQLNRSLAYWRDRS